jgi:hypothetical protein
MAEQVNLVKEAEARGYDSAWVFDGAGPDAVTMLTYLVASTIGRQLVIFPFAAEPDPKATLFRTVRAFPG